MGKTYWAKLQSQNCHDAISSAKVVVDSKAATLHPIGFAISEADVTPTMLVQLIEQNNSKNKKQESKVIDILKKLVGTKNKQIIEGKSACQSEKLSETSSKISH